MSSKEDFFSSIAHSVVLIILCILSFVECFQRFEITVIKIIFQKHRHHLVMFLSVGKLNMYPLNLLDLKILISNRSCLLVWLSLILISGYFI